MRFGEFLKYMRDPVLMRRERLDGETHLFQRLLNLVDHFSEEGVGEFKGARAWIKYWLREAVLRDTEFADDATEDFLDEHGLFRKLERYPAGYMKWNQTFHRDPATPTGDIYIPAYGQVMIPGSNPQIRYERIKPAIIPDGSDEVQVPIRSMGRGSAYNANPDEITAFVDTVAGVDTTTNADGDKLHDAQNAESDDDYRARLLAAKSFYKNLGAKEALEAMLASAGVTATVTKHTDPTYWATFVITVSSLGGHLDCRQYYQMVRAAKPAFERFMTEMDEEGDCAWLTMNGSWERAPDAGRFHWTGDFL